MEQRALVHSAESVLAAGGHHPSGARDWRSRQWAPKRRSLPGAGYCTRQKDALRDGENIHSRQCGSWKKNGGRRRTSDHS